MDGKHISTFESIEELRTFVEKDLKSFGVKLPKSKKTKKLHKSASQDGIVHADKTFGNYLSHVPCDHIDHCGYVPKFLIDVADVIKLNVDMEGIFRKSGAVSRQKELKLLVDQGKSLSTDANVHDATVLMKQFFRELPEPLLTSVYHDSFVGCVQLDAEDFTQAVLMLCLLLPAEHLSTLQFTMQTLQLVAQHAHANKMDETNLATVMAPNIIHLGNHTEKMSGAEERMLEKQVRVVNLLISNADRIGMVSKSLVSRANDLKQWQDQDGQAASDGQMVDDAKDPQKKDKKRKRSGSLHGLMSSFTSGIKSKLRRSIDGSAKNTSQAADSFVTKDDVKENAGTDNSSPADSLPQATPVVLKRKQVLDTPGLSAHKRHAVLQGLPNQSALGGTPMATPGRPDFKMGTPAVERSRLAFHTPATQRSTRKKLNNFFSPSSSKKHKLQKSPSTGILPSQVSKKNKTLNILRRFSGGRGDKSHDQVQNEKVEQDLGEKSQSVSKDFVDDTCNSTLRNHSLPLHISSLASAEEKAAVLSQLTAFAASTAYLRQVGDEGNSVDHAAVSSELAPFAAVSAQTEQGRDVECSEDQTMSLEMTDIADFTAQPRQGLDEGFLLEDTTIDFSETAKFSHLQMSGSGGESSQDSRLKNSLQLSDTQPMDRRAPHLRRGQPNTINNGLPEGNSQKLQNQSLEKSEDGHFFPPLCPELPASRDMAVPLNETFVKPKPSSVPVERKFLAASHQKSSAGQKASSVDNLHAMANSSILKLVLPPPDEFADQNRLESEKDGYDSDESEAGFSTISGGTVIFRPSGGVKQSIASVSGSSLTQGEAGSQGTRSLTPHSSADSLYGSATSSTSSLGSVAPPRPMERSLSADSGKGSLFDDEMPGTVPDKNPSLGAEEKHGVSNTHQTIPDASDARLQNRPGAVPVLAEVFNNDQAYPFPVEDETDEAGRQKKSMSANNLHGRPPTGKPASRSHSINLPHRKHNINPIIPVFGDTQKILERHGYRREKGTSNSTQAHDAVSDRGEKRKASMTEPHQDVQGQEGRRHAPRKESPPDDRAAADISRRRSMDTVPYELETLEHKIKRRRSDQLPTVEPQSHNLDHMAEKRREDGKPPRQPPPVLGPHFEEEAASIIRRAEVVLPKHESILDLHSHGSGRVANAVKQFVQQNESFSSSHSAGVHPLRYPVGIPRQRGKSPVRIPTVFAKGDERANQLKRMAEQMRFKNAQMAAARKDSQCCTVEEEMEAESLEKLPLPKSRSKGSDGSSVTISSLSSSGSSGSHRGHSSLLESLSDLTDSQEDGTEAKNAAHLPASQQGEQSGPAGLQSTDLSSSLVETIQEVCTPLTEKYRRRSQQFERRPLVERNALADSAGPSTPIHFGNTPLADSVVLRTAQGLTPRQVLRFKQSTGGVRSPGRSAKRLSTPSPRSPHYKSPHRKSPYCKSPHYKSPRQAGRSARPGPKEHASSSLSTAPNSNGSESQV